MNYVCANCHREFEDPDPGRAVAEAAATFYVEELEDAVHVCDDCWRAMRFAMADFNARYA